MCEVVKFAVWSSVEAAFEPGTGPEYQPSVLLKSVTWGSLGGLCAYGLITLFHFL